jgi:emfourin
VKVSIVRGGGVAGFATRTEVSTDSLPPDESRALEDKVNQSGLRELPEDASAATRHPDDLLYEVSVEDAGSVHTVRLSESATPDSIRSLIEWVDSVSEHGPKIETLPTEAST